MAELWKEVIGFDTLYEVSNLGHLRTKCNVKGIYTSEYRYVKPTDNGKGYLRFNLKQNKKQVTVYLHRLVAVAFVDNPHDYEEINHIDENKYNNRAENLEWCTHLYNCNFGTRNERSSKKRQKRIKCNELNLYFESIQEAAEWLGVVKTAISNCLNGRTITCGGFTWSYCNEL
ncbi:MAG: HNH endonuclease [Ruminococcus sp.]|nr:HNH endonuclease [Ruminococcus sp.]